MEPERKSNKKRRPKGGAKHQPGRGHDRKSGPGRKGRFSRRAAKRRQQEEDEARKAWGKWDALTDEVKRLLGSAEQPTMPRPRDG